MNCPNPKCNTTGIPDDAKFCPNCGTLLINESITEKKETELSENIRGLLTGVVVVFGVLFLFFALVAILSNL